MFAFTLDIYFYFENTRAKVHWRLQRFSHVSTEFKIIQLKIYHLLFLFTFIIKRIITFEPINNLGHTDPKKSQ